jgi:hypothetical protein
MRVVVLSNKSIAGGHAVYHGNLGILAGGKSAWKSNTYSIFGPVPPTEIDCESCSLSGQRVTVETVHWAIYATSVSVKRYMETFYFSEHGEAGAAHPLSVEALPFSGCLRGSFREAKTWLNVRVNCCREGYCYRLTRLISPLRTFRSSCCSLGRSGRRSFRRLVRDSNTITAMVN